MSDTPVNTGYLEALGTWDPSDGLTGRLEAGIHPYQNLSLFGYAQDSTRSGPEAGIGAKYTFDL